MAAIRTPPPPPLLVHRLGGQISALHINIYVECLLTLQFLKLPFKIVVSKYQSIAYLEYEQ